MADHTSPEDLLCQLWLRHFMPRPLIMNSNSKYVTDCELADLRKSHNSETRSVLTGSQSEGLAVPEYILKSGSRRHTAELVTRDRDEMVLEPNQFVIQVEEDDKKCMLQGRMFEMEAIRDAEPNYVKLKVTEEYRKAKMRAGEPLSVSYVPNQLMTSDAQNVWQSILSTSQRNPWELEMHGPSVTLLNRGKDERDICRAIHFNSWPEISNEFISRERFSCWPHSNLIKAVVRCGHHVAPVGRAQSSSRELEWRVSFSLAERHLARNLPPGSRGVYVYIKLLHTFYLKRPAGLSTYCLKNMLFWICEKVSKDMWTENRLLDMVKLFLDELYHALIQGCIRHYFIPTANLLSSLSMKSRLALARAVNSVKDTLLQCLRSLNSQLYFLGLFTRRPLNNLFTNISHCETKSWNGVCKESVDSSLSDCLWRLLDNELETLRSIVDIEKNTHGWDLKLQRQANENSVCQLALGTLKDICERQIGSREIVDTEIAIFVADTCKERSYRIDLMLKILLHLHNETLSNEKLNESAVHDWLSSVLVSSTWTDEAGNMPSEVQAVIGSIGQRYLDLCGTDIFSQLATATAASDPIASRFHFNPGGAVVPGLSLASGTTGLPGRAARPEQSGVSRTLRAPIRPGHITVTDINIPFASLFRFPQGNRGTAPALGGTTTARAAVPSPEQVRQLTQQLINLHRQQRRGLQTAFSSRPPQRREAETKHIYEDKNSTP